MDVIENLANKASQITMYDLKSYYNQAKNAVLNIPEMEAKVREATNEDPWGASSTLMQEIAQGTHNYQHFNEIMPTIYSRFMEKEAREWRQIYKALTLLEYLIKHGSERVVDNARAHNSTIKMLRNFHYIDEKGKDQGINVRNRANEIVALLGDVEKIRSERRKARSNRNKYQGHEGGMFNTATGSRYGGFGSESYVPGGGSGGGGGGGGYNGGSGSGSGSGSRYGGYGNDDEYRGSSARASSSQQRPEYDEYEGADDFDSRRPSPGSGRASAQASRPPQAPPKPPKDEPKKQQKQPEVNLFDFDDEPAAPASKSAAPAAPVDAFGDDDFDDFQSAAPSAPAPTSPAATAPAAPSGANANLFALLNASSQPMSPVSAASTSPAAQSQPSFGGLGSGMTSPSHQTQSSFGGMSGVASPQRPQPMGGMGMGGMGGMSGGMNSMSGGMASKPASMPAQAQKKSGASAFDDLFTASLGAPSKPQQDGGQKTIAQMQKETTNAGLWGAPKSAGQQTQSKPAPSSGSGDLLDLL